MKLIGWNGRDDQQLYGQTLDRHCCSKILIVNDSPEGWVKRLQPYFIATGVRTQVSIPGLSNPPTPTVHLRRYIDPLENQIIQSGDIQGKALHLLIVRSLCNDIIKVSNTHCGDNADAD